MRLEKELENRGLAVPAETLLEVVRCTFLEDFAGVTVDRFLCHPAKASRFAAKIRLIVDEPGLPTNVILHQLLALRKQSKLD